MTGRSLDSCTSVNTRWGLQRFQRRQGILQVMAHEHPAMAESPSTHLERVRHVSQVDIRMLR